VISALSVSVIPHLVHPRKAVDLLEHITPQCIGHLGGCIGQVSNPPNSNRLSRLVDFAAVSDEVNNDVLRRFIESVKHPIVTDVQLEHASPLSSQCFWFDNVKPILWRGRSLLTKTGDAQGFRSVPASPTGTLIIRRDQS
jgi:hypothetical protein